ncbi:TIGR01777 family oxidoreductase [Desulfopila sp. IMCC35008]|uniref:TIGR01777 family oxidoreductase n=1 Tax=Desulfopila sp. IMCC35008 TaxID=2653858 RepID=UPI0013D7F41D|nr:TIGR01777 family oxidoreductase [Desulfopila sp. IMCC35008]
MTNVSTFTYSSVYPCSARELYDYHARPGALERLLPPWERNTLIRRVGSIKPGGKVLLKIHIGPIPLLWEAHHIEDVPGVRFKDIQHRGPFSQFSHTHSFSNTEAGCKLDDHINFSLPGQALLPPIVATQIRKKLQRSFEYRQHVLYEDILLHQRYSQKPLSILISGASGTLGKTLVPMLTTGGHKVFTLVRRKPDTDKQEIYWQPAKGKIDTGNLPPVDAVIHLAGEYIGLTRWSEAKKRRVLESRVKGTQLLAETIAALPNPPQVFLSASAVGYYGDRADTLLTEEDPPGTGFISNVCARWEKAALPAQKSNIRTIFMRLGVGLTPQGGALNRLISTSPLAYIRYFGSGNQYISWMSIDDMAAAMLHCLATPTLSGAVNIAAPSPVTNKELIEILSRVTSRPRVHPLPATLLTTVFGQMASEIMLSSCRVSCGKLQDSGFRFRHENLESTLRRILGKKIPGSHGEERP